MKEGSKTEYRLQRLEKEVEIQREIIQGVVDALHHLGNVGKLLGEHATKIREAVGHLNEGLEIVNDAVDELNLRQRDVERALAAQVVNQVRQLHSGCTGTACTGESIL